MAVWTLLGDVPGHPLGVSLAGHAHLNQLRFSVLAFLVGCRNPIFLMKTHFSLQVIAQVFTVY